MALRISLTFDADPNPLHAIPMARLLCDLQHLSVMIASLPILERIPTESVVFDPVLQKYTAFIEAPPGSFGFAEVLIATIRRESPLQIDYLLKIPKELASPVRRAFNFIFERVLYGDLERQKRQIANEIALEELRRKRLENFATAHGLRDKIPTYKMELYLSGLGSSIRPFETEHPRITSADVTEDEDSKIM